MARVRPILLSASLAASLTVAAASAAVRPGAPRVSSLVSVRRGNPHLHRSSSPEGARDKSPKHEHDSGLHSDHDRWHDRWHSHWYGIWNSWAYISLHRGLGTITGTVQGGPAGALQVNLRKPGGRQFKIVSKKHTVFTGANGNFLITGVRAGAYRIIARTPNGKHIAHAQVTVHTGHTSAVGIRW